jgi:ABC-type lipoprotein release transport system permease subunit
MKNNKFSIFYTLFTDSSTHLKFALGVVFGFGFSIAVILSTIGIMDGFERSLKQGLKKSTGDLSLNSRQGFFTLDDRLKSILMDQHLTQFAKVVQTESFLIAGEISRGVLVKGIDEFYGSVVGLPINLHPGEIAIGSEIGKTLNLKKGDEVVLAFAKGNTEMKSLPALNRYIVSEVVNHGVYQRDARQVYLPLDEVQKVLELKDKVNSVAISFNKGEMLDQDEEALFKYKMTALSDLLPSEFYLRPYWKDFSSLIEAVKVEKVMISIILQLVVVISIFNVLAFIIFMNEKKAKELFLFKALGLSQRELSRIWYQLVLACWATSCVISLVFVFIFKLLLRYFSVFNLPAEIYHMPRLELYLTYQEYFFVFLMALVWINLITYILLRRMRKKGLLEGLRQEFA